MLSIWPGAIVVGVLFYVVAWIVIPGPGALRSAYVDFLLARVSGTRAWLPVAGAA